MNANNPRTAKHLTLTLADEGYGLPVADVREIIRMQKVTHVPQLPACVKGVINLRGRIVPIVDLRVQFGLPATVDDRTCIVVVAIKPPGRSLISLGLIVDRVDEVATVSQEDIAPPPAFGGTIRTDYLLGMAKLKNGVKMLLNLERVLAFDAMEALTAAA